MMDKGPLISVIMSFWNRESYLKEAIGSLVDQSVGDWELIVVNDASEDDSEQVIRRFGDKRIIILKNKTQLGIPRSLNKALPLCRGAFIAPMDSDDISHRDRFKHQLRFMKHHPNVDICSCWIETFGVQKDIIRKHPVKNIDIKCEMLFSSPLAHPAALFRRSVLSIDKNFKLYDENLPVCHDYYLWARLMKDHSFYNIPKVLLKYRTHNHQIGQLHPQDYIKDVCKVYQFILETIQVDYSQKELNLHQAYCSGTLPKNFYADLVPWIIKLKNAMMAFFPEKTKAVEDYFDWKLIEIYHNIPKELGERAGLFKGHIKWDKYIAKRIKGILKL